MVLEVGQKVRIKETAFGDSDEPGDIAARGKTGIIVLSLEQQFGADWADCWEVQTDDDILNVITEELEPVEE